MMIENPPAFPNDPRTQLGDDYQGMTLRDWFAGQALPKTFWGVNTNPKLAGKSDQELFELAAGTAYLMADAMLRARLPQAALDALGGA